MLHKHTHCREFSEKILRCTKKLVIVRLSLMADLVWVARKRFDERENDALQIQKTCKGCCFSKVVSSTLLLWWIWPEILDFGLFFTRNLIRKPLGDDFTSRSFG